MYAAISHWYAILILSTIFPLKLSKTVQLGDGFTYLVSACLEVGHYCFFLVLRNSLSDWSDFIILSTLFVKFCIEF